MAARPQSPHIVDVLVAERIGGFMASPLWPLFRRPVYWLIGYRPGKQLADEVAGMGPEQAVDHVSRMLALDLDVTGLEHVPAQGRLLIVANHPTGPADGVALFDALRPVRRDLHFYANVDTVRLAPALDGTVIGIEWREHLRTREQARAAVLRTREVFESERAMFIFPAGRIARRERGRLIDQPWQRSALSLARKHRVPVLPVYMTGPRARWIQWLVRVAPPLQDVTLFHEFLNTRGSRFRMVIGRPIPPEALAGDEAAATEALKRYVEHVLPEDPDAVFTPRARAPAAP
jgi:putative hemolysin